MKLPPRPSRSTHSPHSNSLPFSLATHSLRPVQIKHTPIKPGAVVHRKPNKHDFSSCAKEREEVDALDEVVRLNQASLLSVQSGGSAGDVVENKGKEEAELTELIEATKGKGIRAPRTAFAQSLDYDVIPPNPPIVALSDAAVYPINVHPIPSNPSESATSSMKPSSMLARTRAYVSSFGLGRTPDLTRSLETDGGPLERHISPGDIVPSISTMETLPIPTETQSEWERVPSFKNGNMNKLDDDHWVGIEDDNDETLVFWDDIDEDRNIEVGGIDDQVQGQTLTYARVLRG